MGVAGRFLGGRAIGAKGLLIAPEVRRSIETGSPVVALESALVTHGFAPPANLEVAERMIEAIGSEAAVPAVCGVVAGLARVGLSGAELARLASDGDAAKVSLRDLPWACSQGLSGGTTVAASIHLAHRAGIELFATGGIGGAHRGDFDDVSADLPALGSVPIVVVCSGAKSILDLSRTLQILETYGVPVVGYCTNDFPAFYSRCSGLRTSGRVETPADAARVARARTALGLTAAVLLCVPVPEGAAIPQHEAESTIERATAEAEARGVRGSHLTPFLLRRIGEMSDNRTTRANMALLESNARVAAQVARAMAKLN